MDNLTHSVIGFAAGALVAEIVGAIRRDASDSFETTARRVRCISLGVIGGNLPDSDLLVSYGSGSLGYLLQHRGYTHTILGCVLLAAALFLVTLFVLRRRSRTVHATERVALAAMALLAVFLHLGMDWLNSYGVHPYWPVDDHWHYGDRVFIIEPWYWIAAAPLWATLRSIAGKIALGLVLTAAMVSAAIVHWNALHWALVMALVGVALLLLGRKSGRRIAAVTAAVCMASVTLAFDAGHHTALTALDAQARRHFGDEQVIDRILTPSPTTPFCWDVLLLHRQGDELITRHGMLAIGWQSDARACPRPLPDRGTTAEWNPVDSAASATMHWFGEFRMPKTRLADLAAVDCRVGALMQFARAPFAQQKDGRWIVGDLRFDREPGVGFAEIEVALTEACVVEVPWLAPRAELLGVAQRSR